MSRFRSLAAALLPVAPCAASVAGCGDGNPSAAERPAIVWAVGDAADGSDEGRAVAGMIAGSGRVDRLLYLGDVYENGTYDDFVERYEPLYGRWARQPRPCRRPRVAKPRAGLRPLIVRADRPQTPAPDGPCACGWEIVSINVEQPHHRGSSQLSWRRSQLQEDGNCRIFFGHSPRCSASDRHGDQEDMAAASQAIRGRAVIGIGADDPTMQQLRPIGRNRAVRTRCGRTAAVQRGRGRPPTGVRVGRRLRRSWASSCGPGQPAMPSWSPTGASCTRGPSAVARWARDRGDDGDLR